MKKNIFLLLLSISFFACDNSLNLIEEGADVSVVYSLLSASTDDQIVRLEKGFIDPLLPATEIAQIPDSIYYTNATVTLRNVTQGTSYNLSRKESSELGKERESGFFLSDPNYVYHYSGQPSDFEFNDQVELVIQKDEDSDPITASVNLLEELLVIAPQSEKFSNFPTEAKYKVQWVKAANNPGIEYTITMDMNISEADLSDEEPEFEEKVLTWNYSTVKNAEVAEVPGIEFYKFFSNNLEANPTLVRQFNYFSVRIVYSGEEMEKFQSFLTANTGITSSQPIPPYTNLSSGLGLVAEKEVRIIDNIFLGTASKDSLREGRFTKDLNFQ